MKFRLQENSVFTLAFLCLLGLVLTACDVKVTSLQSNTSTVTTNITGQGQNLQLFVEPDDGEGVITGVIQGAKKSIWVEVYLLTDKHVLDDLEAAAHRGLDVRVMLETHPYGSGSASPTLTLDKLKAAGAKAQATSSKYALTHEKGMIVDGNTVYIMTSNLTYSALGSSSSYKNREYGIIDRSQQDVDAVIAIFNADWNNRDVQITDTNLVVSPANSRSAFLAFIKGAQRSLVIEAEELQDDEIEQALIDAVKRGAQVQVILPASKGSSDENASGDSNGQGITTVKQNGVQVKKDSNLYMHAKMMIADGQRAFLGSENISTASLDRNRELGIIVSDQTIVHRLQQTFGKDWSDSTAA